MNPETLLLCRRLPSRLNAEQAAVLIGCSPHDIPILVREKLLKPLGTPSPNSVKWFSSKELEERLSDEKWCARVTNRLYDYWREKRKPTRTK